MKNHNQMSQKEQQFAEITTEITEQIRPELVDCFNKNKTEKQGAVICNLDKKLLSGRGKLEYYFTSPTCNEPLWKAIPPELKTRIREYPNCIYVLFFGWDGLISSFVLSDTPMDKKPLSEKLKAFFKH